MQKSNFANEVEWKIVLPSNPATDQVLIINQGKSHIEYGNGGMMQVLSIAMDVQGPVNEARFRPSSSERLVAKQSGSFPGLSLTLDTQGYGVSATQAQYDLGIPPYEVDERGVEKTYEYDADFNRTRVTYVADGTFEQTSYNTFRQPTRQRDRLGNVKLTSYNAQGLKISETVGLKETANGDVQTSAYAVRTFDYYPSTHASKGLLQTEKSALYSATTPTLYRTDYEYNAAGKVTKKIDPAPAVSASRPETTYSYDTNSRLSSTIDPLGRVTSYSYDGLGRVVQVTYPDTTTSQTLYDSNGRVAKTKDRVEVVTYNTWDTSGRLTEVKQGAAIDSNILDQSPDQTVVTNPNQLSIATSVYLPGSDLKSRSVVNGAVTDYVYDSQNRVTEVKQYPRTGVTLSSKKFYLNDQLLYDEDAYGRRKYYGYRASDGTLIRTVTCTHPGYTLADFTAVWNLTRSTAANAAYIIHDAIRDDAGHLTQVIDGRGTETRYEYDAQGREIRKTAAYGTSVAAVTETDYDADGRTIEVRSPRYFDSSDTEGYQKANENWTYDGAGRVATHTEATGSSVAATESFTYFADGRQQTHTDYRGKVWTNIDDTCCGKSTASKNPLGHGSIRNTDPQRRVVHSVTVSNVDTHTANMLDQSTLVLWLNLLPSMIR